MISFEPFWSTLSKRGITTYELIYRHGLSANTIHRIKHGEAITTKTLNELCFILNCPVSDIIEYVVSDDD
ncbi:MAG: XRE family transcriptional regulator [Ruminococcaceae bacterium]|nr:XRE family transcriptional regulator [Oscillospiraceae bacterium]